MANYLILSVAELVLFIAITFSVKLFAEKKSVLTYLYWCGGLFLTVGAINYFLMPVLQWWGFEGVWIETSLVSAVGFITAVAFYIDQSDLGWREKEAIQKRRKELKRFSKEWFVEYKDWVRALPLVITLIAPVVAWFQSAEVWNSEKYLKRLTVEEVADTTFKKNIAAIDITKVLTVDDTLAKKVAEDVLGNDAGLGSKVEIGEPTLQNFTGEFTINGGKKLSFKDAPLWVAPLEHRSFFKYRANKTTPGYVIIDATNSDNRYLVTEVNGRPLALKYLESAWFNDDVERHIKVIGGYLHKGLNDHSFEIDPNGQPYWVLSSYEQTVGFCGEESEGPILVNAETGEIKAYTIADAPEWVDRIQPKEFIREQIKHWGEYQKGYLNACWFARQDGVMAPTPGMTLVYSHGKSYWYTGIKSAASDAGTNGFMLVDTRTKEAKFYRNALPGFNEDAAREIADGQETASAAGYHATFPVLYNVRGIPTYFMVYKDVSGNVQGYCFVSSNNRSAVGCDKLKSEALRKYQDMLKALKLDGMTDSKVEAVSLDATVRGIVLEEGSYYILLNEKSGFEFTGKSTNFPEMKWTKIGDKVKVVFNIGEDKVVPLESFDNLSFDI